MGLDNARISNTQNFDSLNSLSKKMSSNIFADLLVNDFPGSRDSEDADDLASLPFPQPISRAVFSSPDFNTESFLVSHSQFRTLDDLRLELRQWVDKLENEMESLIEEDWQGYFTLGRGLAGGEVTVDNVERRVKQFERDVQVPPPSVQGVDVDC